MPKISIIVPVYNVGKYLEKCLDSLVHQTLEDIEVLVINDSSPDNSQVIIEQFALKYPKIIKPHLKPNGGVSSVRNYGIKQATGDYIGFVDGDDYVEPDMYETLYKEATVSNANVVISDFYFTYPDKEVPYHEFHSENTEEMIINLFAVLWNKIYKRTYLEKINFHFIEGYRYEDVSFLTRLAPYYENYRYVNKPLVHYVQRQSSSSYSHNYKVKEIVYILSDILDFYKTRGFYVQYERELEYVFIKYSLGQPFRSCSKISDKNDRVTSLNMLWNNLNNNFPGWRNNPYLKSLPGIKHKYFRIVNKSVFWLSAMINKYI
ncbi:MAG: glycosyltransferase [Erysipelotrichaceae bacterium]|nr:glycosyltransferase [Erysipelotrichaceae bacterium]